MEETRKTISTKQWQAIVMINTAYVTVNEEITQIDDDPPQIRRSLNVSFAGSDTEELTSAEAREFADALLTAAAKFEQLGREAK